MKARVSGATARVQSHNTGMLRGYFQKLRPRRFAEDFDQTVGDQPILPVFKLPDCKTEAIRIARRPVMTGVCISVSPIRVPSAHAACACAHASDSEWPSVR